MVKSKTFFFSCRHRKRQTAFWEPWTVGFLFNYRLFCWFPVEAPRSSYCLLVHPITTLVSKLFWFCFLECAFYLGEMKLVDSFLRSPVTLPSLSVFPQSLSAPFPYFWKPFPHTLIFGVLFIYLFKSSVEDMVCMFLILLVVLDWFLQGNYVLLLCSNRQAGSSGLFM